MISLLFLCFTTRLHRSDMIMSNFLEASGNSWKSTKNIVFSKINEWICLFILPPIYFIFISIDPNFVVDTNKLQYIFGGGVGHLYFTFLRPLYFIHSSGIETSFTALRHSKPHDRKNCAAKRRAFFLNVEKFSLSTTPPPHTSAVWSKTAAL